MAVVATPPPPPFRIFPRAVFAFLLGLSFGQFAQPLSKYLCINEKKKFKNFAVKKAGGWRLQQPTPSEREGVAAKINTFS